MTLRRDGMAGVVNAVWRLSDIAEHCLVAYYTPSSLYHCRQHTIVNVVTCRRPRQVTMSSALDREQEWSTRHTPLPRRLFRLVVAAGNIGYA